MRETILFVGHARLPQASAARVMYETLALTVEVEPVHGTILRAECSLVTSLAREFIKTLLAGHRLSDGIDFLLERIERRYQGAAQSAIMAALKNLHRDYLAWKEQQQPGS